MSICTAARKRKWERKTNQPVSFVSSFFTKLIIKTWKKKSLLPLVGLDFCLWWLWLGLVNPEQTLICILSICINVSHVLIILHKYCSRFQSIFSFLLPLVGLGSQSPTIRSVCKRSDVVVLIERISRADKCSRQNTSQDGAKQKTFWYFHISSKSEATLLVLTREDVNLSTTNITDHR